MGHVAGRARHRVFTEGGAGAREFDALLRVRERQEQGATRLLSWQVLVSKDQNDIRHQCGVRA